ncbi:MAG: hypothetical protein GY869_24350, partial [Planctomycetes bacterium]|nr:hypothetical protein [Planctomycetota bacterium]
EPVDFVFWISKEQVEPNGYNPNDVSPPEMRLLEVSIHHDGFTHPVVGYPLSDVITRLSNDGMLLTEIADYLVEDIDTITRFADLDNGQIVVDGEHRSIIGKTKKRIAKRVFDYLPVASLQREHIHPNDRMAGTIRHNRARGVHAVEPMADIVATLIRRGWTDDEVARELGMDADEVLRFKQNVGLPELFKTHDYSRAWR